jgi:hypothetical protein
MKMNDTQQEFLNQITQIYKHFKVIKKSPKKDNQIIINELYDI